jgi:cytochrome c5
MNKLTLAVLFSAVALAACSKQESAPAPAPAPAETPAPAPAPAPEPAPAPAAAPASEPAASGATGAASDATTTMAAAGGGAADGQSVFNKTCALCHAAGVAGAPKLGDKADWGPRIAQGKDTLYQHAINGFTGQKGTMPPKGGNTALSDADVKAAVDFMVGKAS